MFSVSSGCRESFREVNSLWGAAEEFLKWSQQMSRGFETWSGDSCENAIRNYEIQTTHTYSLAPAGALAAGLYPINISAPWWRVPLPE